MGTGLSELILFSSVQLKRVEGGYGFRFGINPHVNDATMKVCGGGAVVWWWVGKPNIETTRRLHVDQFIVQYSMV